MISTPYIPWRDRFHRLASCLNFMVLIYSRLYVWLLRVCSWIQWMNSCKMGKLMFCWYYKSNKNIHITQKNVFIKNMPWVQKFCQQCIEEWHTGLSRHCRLCVCGRPHMVDCGLGLYHVFCLTGVYQQCVGACCLHPHTYHEDGASRFHSLKNW